MSEPFVENLLCSDTAGRTREVLFCSLCSRPFFGSDGVEDTICYVFETTMYFAFFSAIYQPLCYHIDSNKVSNSKLKLDHCNCVKIEMIESTAPPQ